MVAQDNDFREKPLLLLVNYARAEQGLPVVDPNKEVYVMMRGYNPNDKADFKDACATALVQETGSAGFTPEAVANKASEFRASGHSTISVDVISPDKPGTGGIYKIGDFTAPRTDSRSEINIENYSSTVVHLAAQAQAIKNRQSGNVQPRSATALKM